MGVGESGMTFTFGEDLSDDLDFVRFKTADTIQDQAYMSDELITSLLSEYSNKQAATVAAARYILTRMAQPKFKADWLEIDPGSSLTIRRKLLEDLISELDPSAESISVDTVNTYRADSGQTAAPDYSTGRDWTGLET